jgi:hypothetical protein
MFVTVDAVVKAAGGTQRRERRNYTMLRAGRKTSPPAGRRAVCMHLHVEGGWCGGSVRLSRPARRHTYDHKYVRPARPFNSIVWPDQSSSRQAQVQYVRRHQSAFTFSFPRSSSHWPRYRIGFLLFVVRRRASWYDFSCRADWYSDRHQRVFQYAKKLRACMVIADVVPPFIRRRRRWKMFLCDIDIGI